jgi:hypothetical protein
MTPSSRWREDVRVGAIYFDKFGRNGAVSEMPASFEGSFLKWLSFG